ncbi:MAG: winged helix-turn-helix domain-containing protein [Chloracidobacterium sp.]|nr:winged helix-turn-helix domain-containing protein [Chloracidobacterium sp.]
MNSSGSTITRAYEFEDFVLRPSERLLLRNGKPVPLKAKVFETLLNLVRNRDRVLSKEDLMSLIWSDRCVEESNLSQNIFVLRRTLGERPRDHRFIVTHPGHGYRFVANVREIEASDKRPSNGAVASEQRRRIESIAILPPGSYEPGAENETLGLALADTLITQLTARGPVSVRSTAAVIKYIGSGKEPLIIGRELSVDAILSGTIYRIRGNLLVNLQLSEVSTGETTWANRFELPASEFLELQTEIADEVVEALSAELARPPDRAVRSMPKNPDNYQKYLRGRFLWERRTEADMLEGLATVKEVVELEPEFPLGYIGVADSYLLLGEYLFLAPDESFPFAREAAEKALELDPNLAQGHASLAEYYHYYEKDQARAEDHYLQANELNPNYASARHWYAWSLMSYERFDEALDQIERAQAAEPNSLALSTTRGLPFYFRRDYDRAIRQFEMVLGIQPNLAYARYYLGSALVHNGDATAAIREFETILEAEQLQQAIALLGYSYAEAGMYDKASEQLRLLDDLGQTRYISPYVRAIVHCGLGDILDALDQLELACQEHAPWLVWLRIDPFLSRLWGEPRFERLLDRLSLR